MKKIKCTKEAWSSLMYSVPVSVAVFSSWIVSLVSLGYLYGIYNTNYNVSATHDDSSPQGLNVCIAYITDDLMRTYLVPQWLLVFFLPITMAVYILALATDHWLAELFSYCIACFSISCCGAVVFLLGQNLVLIARGDCTSEPQLSGSVTGFVGNSITVMFLTLSLALISMKKRCDRRRTADTAKSTAVMNEIKQNLPIEMRVNDLYGLSQSVTNLPQRDDDDGFGTGIYRQKSQISVYEDVP